jgi:CCR4-NOT transcription complex subunit 1
MVVRRRPLVTIYIEGKPFHPNTMESLLQKQHDASKASDGGKIEIPPDGVADRLNFIINNSTDNNINVKVREAKEILEPKYFKWLANQLVVKRICTQPNYHQTYLKFMTALKMDGFEDAVLECTYENIRKLLSSDKIQTSTQDRSLLKNIGSWLGMITLARDRPVLARCLDLKELLYMAFEEGKLIAVAPFVAKVMDGCKTSTVFKPPNPWVIGLVRTLKEIYDVPDLKLNLKFEVEVLCQTLNLTLTRIQPSKYLSQRKIPSMQDNPDFNARAHQRAANEERERKMRADLEEKRVAEMTTAQLPTPSGEAGTQPLPADTVIPNLAAYIIINENLLLFQQTPSLKRVVPVAVDRAIRDIIQPVVERSVTIGVMTTRELVIKDFAMEPDETKLRQAAHLMVSNLAGSLALVTCREPLRQSMVSHLRTLLSPSVQDQQMLEQVITQCSQDNLELGWRLIEKAATEKAMRDIDETLSNAIQVRRRHREQTGQKYYDTSIFTNGSRYPTALPPPLLPQPQPQGLSNIQLMVYENFKFMPRQQLMQQPAVAGDPGAPAYVGGAEPPGGTTTNGVGGSAISTSDVAPSATRGDGSLMKRALSTEPPEHATGSGVTSALMDSNQSLQGFFRCVTQLDHVMTQVAPQLQASNSPPENIVNDPNVQQIMVGIATNYNLTSPAHKMEACHQFAHRVFNRTVERSNDPVSVAAYCQVLSVLKQEGCPSLKEVLTKWTVTLLSQTRVPPFNVVIPVSLISRGLLHICRFDECMASQIPMNILMGPQPIAPPYAEMLRHISTIVRTTVVKMRTVDTCDLHITLNRFREVARNHGQSTDPVILALLHDVHQFSPRSASDSNRPTMPAVSKEKDPPNIRQEIERLLVSWVGAVEQNGGEQSYSPFLRELQGRGFLQGDDAIERLFRIMAELCVERFVQTGQYLGIDAFSKLILLLVKYTNGGNPNTQVLLLSKVLIILARLLAWHSDESARQTQAAKDASSKKLSDESNSGGSKKSGTGKNGGSSATKGIQNPEEDTNESGGSGTKEQDMENRDALVNVAAHAFDPRPFCRLFANIIEDFTAPESGFQGEVSRLRVLTAIGNTLHAVQPSRVPQFAFAWVELISHRSFMPLLLDSPNQGGWMLMQVLLCDALSFMRPYLQSVELTDSIRTLYKGLLCILLVLLHDYPSFLCQYHFAFCDLIPTTCVQLRNLVLSAFPRTMRLPDPFTPNLVVSELPEISIAPRILSDYLVSS